MSVEEFIDAMARDKKVVDGALRFVLLTAIGTAIVTKDVPLERCKTVSLPVKYTIDKLSLARLLPYLRRLSLLYTSFFSRLPTAKT